MGMMQKSRLQWLQDRQSGIGGSEMAAVCGLNAYKTPSQVWESKVNTIIADDSTSEAAYWGTTLEDLVAKEYAKRTGRKVQKINEQMRHPEFDFAIANIDRAVINPDISGNVRWKDGKLTTDRILECKTANGFMVKQWGASGTDSVPEAYLIQCQWYLAITGASVCDLAVLIGGQDFRIYTINRDDDLIGNLLAIGADFWQLVQSNTAPDPANYAECAQKWQQADPALTIEATEQLVDMIDRKNSLEADIKTMDAEIDSIKTAISTHMQDAETLTYKGVKIATWKTQASNRFDSTAFKKAHPDLSALFTKTGTSRVLRIA